MNNLMIENIDKNIKSINQKCKQLLSIQIKIKNENAKYQRDLEKLKNKHMKKLTKLEQSQTQITQFLSQINTQISNSSPCGDEISHYTPLQNARVINEIFTPQGLKNNL
ncbi:hypothetical protein F1B92_03875 [Campylobacter sp. FMV-PI01]|uniref:Uncharacterized protein n=1 Tax=Campylobacter portucalensis TaxID=2608384 RepID=A0A6L5WJZ0_9BACT|nr:hypothetical protein [Campylobacter portucalensis]MSN96335.1 hypothetical protein [Campylobacter portucalensis]